MIRTALILVSFLAVAFAASSTVNVVGITEVYNGTRLSTPVDPLSTRYAFCVAPGSLLSGSTFNMTIEFRHAKGATSKISTFHWPWTSFSSAYNTASEIPGTGSLLRSSFPSTKNWNGFEFNNYLIEKGIVAGVVTLTEPRNSVDSSPILVSVSINAAYALTFTRVGADACANPSKIYNDGQGDINRIPISPRQAEEIKNIFALMATLIGQSIAAVIAIFVAILVGMIAVVIGCICLCVRCCCVSERRQTHEINLNYVPMQVMPQPGAVPAQAAPQYVATTPAPAPMQAYYPSTPNTFTYVQ